MSYYEDRKDYNYYKYVIELLRLYSVSFGKLPSILDVGCADTPIVTYGDFTERYTIDLADRPDMKGVNKIIGDFMNEEFKTRYSVVLCLQTIEHVENPSDFIAKLFSVADKFLIISVPIKWMPMKGHVSDHITEETVIKWAARTASYSRTIKDGCHLRGVFVYEL